MGMWQPLVSQLGGHGPLGTTPSHRGIMDEIPVYAYR